MNGSTFLDSITSPAIILSFKSLLKGILKIRLTEHTFGQSLSFLRLRALIGSLGLSWCCRCCFKFFCNNKVCYLLTIFFYLHCYLTLLYSLPVGRVETSSTDFHEKPLYVCQDFFCNNKIVHSLHICKGTHLFLQYFDGFSCADLN